ADAATAGQITYEVRVALDRWEPRITVSDVVVRFDKADRSRLLIEIEYLLRSINDPRNLVFHFYVIPTDENVAAVPEDGAGCPCPPRTLTTAGSRTWLTTRSDWCSSAVQNGQTTTCPTPA